MQRLDYSTEYGRLKYVIDELAKRHVSMRELARAAGYHPTAVSCLLPRLLRGENVAARKWAALWRVLRVNAQWWISGQGQPRFNADARASEIRTKAAEDLMREKSRLTPAGP